MHFLDFFGPPKKSSKMQKCETVKSKKLANEIQNEAQKMLFSDFLYENFKKVFRGLGGFEYFFDQVFQVQLEPDNGNQKTCPDIVVRLPKAHSTLKFQKKYMPLNFHPPKNNRYSVCNLSLFLEQ